MITYRTYCSLGLIDLTDSLSEDDSVELQEAIQHSLAETCNIP